MTLTLTLTMLPHIKSFLRGQLAEWLNFILSSSAKVKGGLVAVCSFNSLESGHSGRVGCFVAVSSSGMGP